MRRYLFIIAILSISLSAMAKRPEGYPSERVLHLPMVNINPGSEVQILSPLYFPKGVNKITYTNSYRFTLDAFYERGEYLGESFIRYVDTCSVYISKTSDKLIEIPKEAIIHVIDIKEHQRGGITLLATIKNQDYRPISITCTPYSQEFMENQDGVIERKFPKKYIQAQIGHLFSAFYGDRSPTKIKLKLNTK
jgi:hypothetical protein